MTRTLSSCQTHWNHSLYLTGLFFPILLQVRSGPHDSPKQNPRILLMQDFLQDGCRFGRQTKHVSVCSPYKDQTKWTVAELADYSLTEPSTLVHWPNAMAVYCAYMKQMRLPSTGWQWLLAHDNNNFLTSVRETDDGQEHRSSSTDNCQEEEMPKLGFCQTCLNVDDGGVREQQTKHT